MSVLTRVLRAGEGKKVRRLAELVPMVNDLEPEIEALDDGELARSTVRFRERLDQGESLEDLLVEAFAVVRETAWRTLGQRHFDVQLMGGMALHFGWIAEMKTGEGKTLVSTLPAYLNALAGEGVHVVTVNDYLATRDAGWMGQIYRFLGMEVGRIGPDISDPELKRQAYNADITYGTNTEFGFDYLRDNMARTRDAMVQRGHDFAIVDEVDSILIDEARTPLIISGPADESARLYYQFASVVRTLQRDEDYEVDEEKRLVVPLESGIEKVEKILGVNNMYEAVSVNYVHHLTQALRAKDLYKRDKDYLVDQGDVKIVDEFTGRTLEGRRWSDGLHQAVEAKERVRIKEENHTWATVTLQNYFRLYDKLAGMTGTAETEAAEFASTYQLQVVPIPTNLPMIRADEADLIFKSEDAKFAAVADDIAERNEMGQPVLVGTASVAKSERLSSLLQRRGIPHEVLNAKQHFREAEIVAQAGRLGAVTVATNMAGRGVDIILGGNSELLARREAQGRELDPAEDEGKAELAQLEGEFRKICEEEGDQVRELGGLYVLGSERHESRRIDNQLRGRSGRQGDPGESRFYLSLEDDLMRLFATGAMNWVMGRALPDDAPIEAKMVTRAIERAQNTVEGRNSEIRKDVLKYDEVMDKQRKVVYALRLQIIDGEDLYQRTIDLLEATTESLVNSACPSDYPEEWELDRLLAEVTQYYPTKFTVDDLAQATSAAQVAESLIVEANEYYEEHSASMPGDDDSARQIERDLMLQIIDNRWREHLSEMDYLREGINLRAMGQQDPLVAWQQEGFNMFEQLMDAIDDDYLRYVMHVEAIETPAAEPDLAQATYAAADDPVAGTVALTGALAAERGVAVDAIAKAASGAPVPDASAQAGPSRAERRAAARSGLGPAAGAGGAVGMEGAGGTNAGGRSASGSDGSSRATSNGGAASQGSGAAASRRDARSSRSPGTPDSPGTGGSQDALSKPGRNQPCWCGSGRKYKLCHGAA